MNTRNDLLVQELLKDSNFSLYKSIDYYLFL